MSTRRIDGLIFEIISLKRSKELLVRVHNELEMKSELSTNLTRDVNLYFSNRKEKLDDDNKP